MNPHVIIVIAAILLLALSSFLVDTIIAFFRRLR